MLQRIASGTVLLLMAAALTGCMAVASPAVGLVYTEVKFGDTATTATGGTKMGKACATSILALFATGDASIEAAKASGGVSEVSFVDHTAKNMLGIFGEFCTIVKGK